MAESESRTSQDVALLYAPTEDGTGARILRARNGTIETGEVRPAKEGQPLNKGELVRLRPRSETPNICDVEVVYREKPAADRAPSAHGGAQPESVAAGLSGPAQVATESYRDNWDRIFGGAAARRRAALN
jgi:hypothetical protein